MLYARKYTTEDSKIRDILLQMDYDVIKIAVSCRFANYSVEPLTCIPVDQSFERVWTIVPDFDKNFIIRFTRLHAAQFELIDWNFLSRPES